MNAKGTDGQQSGFYVVSVSCSLSLDNRVLMSIRLTSASLLAVVVAAACSDAPTASFIDTTHIAPSTTSACASPITLTAGQVMPAVSGTNVCVSAGTGSAEFALIPFNGATSSTTATFDVVANGT